MKKKVRVRVSNRQKSDGDSTVYITNEEGIYNADTGLLSYSEDAGDNSRIINVIHIREDMIEVRKSGAVLSVMCFEKGRATEGRYCTGYGDHRLNIYTIELSVSNSSEGVSIELKYMLTMDETPIGSNDMKIEVRI